jgi:hypothetical protein
MVQGRGDAIMEELGVIFIQLWGADVCEGKMQYRKKERNRL